MSARRHPQQSDAASNRSRIRRSGGAAYSRANAWRAANACPDAVAVAARPASIEADPQFASLAARQIEVYLDAARGLPNKLIARRLGIAESTVKTHLTSVFVALGVRNRTDAAYQASREGLRIA